MRLNCQLDRGAARARHTEVATFAREDLATRPVSPRGARGQSIGSCSSHTKHRGRLSPDAPSKSGRRLKGCPTGATAC